MHAVVREKLKFRSRKCSTCCRDFAVGVSRLAGKLVVTLAVLVVA
jgi:hypothetical protein